GIRDKLVTGVQTCALPISRAFSFASARAISIDEGPVIEIARALAKENALADRIVFINASSYDATIDEKVDVIVTETMGNTGLDEIGRASCRERGEIGVMAG